MVRFLAGEFGVARTGIEVVFGHKNVNKQLRIIGHTTLGPCRDPIDRCANRHIAISRADVDRIQLIPLPIGETHDSSHAKRSTETLGPNGPMGLGRLVTHLVCDVSIRHSTQPT
jgi:hypothetical protein